MVNETTPLLHDDVPTVLPSVAAEAKPASDRVQIKECVLIAIISCSGFLNIFTAQSTILMLPTIGSAYNVPIHRQHLITSLYNIASGSLILLWARVADVYGSGLIFLVGSTLFTITSAGLPLSPNEGTLYMFRAFQGIGTAASLPSSIGILAATFPAGKRRNYALVVYNSISSLGAVFGNITGGIIGGYSSWKWVFWSAAILGAMVTLVAARTVPWRGLAPKTSLQGLEKASSVDWLGGALVTASLTTLLVTISNGGSWNELQNPLQLVLGLFMGYMFIRRQRKLEGNPMQPPLFRLSLLSIPGLSPALFTYACFVASFNAFLVYASLFYQRYLGLSVLETTLRFIPSGLSCCLIALFVAPALSAISGFHLLIGAIFASIVSALLFTVPIPPSTSYWLYGLPAMCLTMSVEVLAPVLSLFVVKCLDQDNQALGGGLLQTSNNIGKAVGLAIAGLVQRLVETILAPVCKDCEVGTLAAKSEGRVGDQILLTGIRAAQCANIIFAVLALITTLVYLRKLRTL
ncbi:MFS general substrate transporter [Lojkania enalia]|uniref:MFS general substrate transporter n=1 Tax=Lojkania enalia TaxID=147567 RepID=A0A9P4JX83_9PLEO|nr:MFS general substrate transporter [Didymosphaeria enalia]